MKIAIAYFIISGLYVYIGLQYWDANHGVAPPNEDVAEAEREEAPKDEREKPIE